MGRSWNELNTLEKEGLRQILLNEGWKPCNLTSINDGNMTTENAMTKRMTSYSKMKDVTVCLKDFHVDED